MAEYIDQTGRMLYIPDTPSRIISLVPSITELLSFLKLDEQTVGITKFCVHPAAWHQHKQRIGGTKNPNMALIQSLNPSIVFASKEENRLEDIEEIEKFCPVWVTDVKDYASALEMISDIGKITSTSTLAEELIESIQIKFSELSRVARPKLAAYIIWKNPWMSVGGDTFIHSMMEKAGFQNILADQCRYPNIDPEELKEMGAEVILLSTEPFPFKQDDADKLTETLGIEVILVDGEYFSWYGSRMVEAVGYFRELGY